MASNFDALDSIYKWIDRKPLTEAVAWSPREKFWLITAVRHYGIHDWKSIAQVVRNSGEPYRPREWFTTKSCERQYKIIVSNYNKETKLPLHEMLPHIAEALKHDYVRDANKSKDNLKAKYCSLFNVLNRMKQGNLSRQEVISLYSHTKSNETESKQYVDQLLKRQNDSLALENTNSSVSDEPIKWNTPSAPLLTSLLRSRNTIPANRTVTTITSLLQSPCGPPRTRSGKLLPLSTSKIQGTPTLSKLLEAPANPYIPSPALSIQKIKPIDIVGTDKVLVVGNISRNENLQPSTVNIVQIDNLTPGSLNQINKSTDLSILKRQMPKSTVSAVNNGSKENLNIVDLCDSDNEEDTTNSIQNIQPKNLFGEKKDTVISTNNSFNTIYRIEPRTTRSQTRAEGGFKPFNDSKLSDMNKDQENLQQLSGGSQMTGTNSIEDELIDIDQIEIEPLSSVHDEIITQRPLNNKFPPRSCIQISQINNSIDDILTNNLLNCKEINNQLLEEISASFAINTPTKNVTPEYKNIMVGQSRIGNGNIPGCLIPIDVSAVKDTILFRKEGQNFLNSGNTLTTLNDRKLLNKKKIIELKGTNIRCVDSRNDTKVVSINNQPVVIVNQIKKPFNIRLTSDQKDITDTLQVSNIIKKPIRLQNNPPKVVHLFDGGNCSLSDEVIIIDDDVNIINDDERALNKIRELSVQDGCKNLSLTVIETNNSSNSGSSKSAGLHFDEKGSKNNIPWKMFGKTQNILDSSSKNPTNQDSSSTSTIGNNSNICQTSNQLIKEIDFDFDHSISQTSLSELYNGVEEIVEMHSFDNEELNSLIDCGSLDNNETEDRENIIINIDQSDSLISESDSTIGAFDSFAQITGVSQNSSCSKSINSLNRNSTTATEENNFDRVGFVQSGVIVDDQISAVSVPGIPLLQGVISNVMNEIDTDHVVTYKDVGSQHISVDEIVEISSDEEEIVSNTIQFSSNISDRNITEAYNKGKNTYTSKEGLKNSHELESTIIIELDDSLETDDLVTKNSEHNIQEIQNFVIVRKSDVVNVNKGHLVANNIHSNRETERTENEVMLLRSNDNKLMNTNIIKETNMEARAEKTNLKLSSGPLKIPQINTEKNKSVIVFEEQMFKKSKEIQEKNDQEKKTINMHEKKEKEFESVIVRGCNESVIKRVKDFTSFNNEYEAVIVQQANKRNEIEEQKLESNRVREAELLKHAKEIEAIKTREAEIKRIEEVKVQKAKEAEVQRAKDMEILKAKEAEVQRAKEMEILKAKEAEVQRAKEIEAQRAEEAKIQRAKEIEAQRAEEAKIQKAKEIEAQRAEEAKIQRAKEIEAQRAEEAKIQRAKEIEAQRAEEAKIQRAKEIEEQRAEEAKIQRAKEIEAQRAEEAKIQRAIEIEAQRAEEAKIQRAKEIEAQKAKEIEAQKAKEIEVQRARNAEIQRAKELEIKQLRKTEMLKKREAEIKKRLEAELQIIEEESRILAETVNQKKREIEDKTRSIKEAEMKKATEEINLRKAMENEKKKTEDLVEKKERGIITRTKEVEFKRLKDIAPKEAEIIKIKEIEMRKQQIEEIEKKLLKEKSALALESQLNKAKKQERRISIETRKNNIKLMETEKMKKEQELKKTVESVVKNVDVESKMMTRRRKSKAEDKANLNIKSTTLKCSCCDNPIDSLEYDTFIKSSTSNNDNKKPTSNNDNKKPTSNNDNKKPISNNDNKKPTSNNDNKKPTSNNDNKKPTSNNDNKKPTSNVKDEHKLINLVSNSTEVNSESVSAKKESSTCSKKITKKDSTSQVISGKSRTRSSLPPKLGKTVESKSTSSQKSINKSETGSILKPITTQRRFIINDIPVASGYNCQNSIELIKKEASKTFMNKEMLTIPVVIVNTNDVKEYRERLAEKQALQAKLLKDNSKNLEPKIANKEVKLQKEIDDNKKIAPKKRGRKRRISTPNEKIQPPKKKANQAVKNIQLPKVEIEPPTKRTRSTTLKETKKIKTCNEKVKIINKDKRKGVLKRLYEKLCGNNKFLLEVEKHARDLTPEDLLIIKQPIFLRDIKRKIAEGSIRTATQLHNDLLIMSFNSIFINKSNTLVFSEATALQRDLLANSQLLQNVMKNSHHNVDAFKEVDEYIPILEKPKTKIVGGTVDDSDDEYYTDYDTDFYNSYYRELSGLLKKSKTSNHKMKSVLDLSDFEPDDSETPDFNEYDVVPIKRRKREI